MAKSNYNALADLVTGFPLSELALSEDSGLQTIASSGTIITDAPYTRLTNAGAVTGVIMAKGRRKGQTCLVVNEAANTITMAVQATSNVRMGATCAILTLRAALFIWDGSTYWDCVLSA